MFLRALRRSAAVLAAATVLGAAAAAPAMAAPAAQFKDAPHKGAKLPEGLYGTSDPTYDGVWRQSVALLALDAAGATPSDGAVDWLAGQQCDDGSFPAYRATPRAGDCDPKKTPSDTNSTAIAVQALSAVGGHGKAVHRSLHWLTSVQNDDGGWGYASGGATDANSVSVVIGAYAAAGREPGKVRTGGRSPYDALGTLQLGCDAKAADRGAFAFQPDKSGKLAANEDATAASALGALGKGLLTRPGKAADAHPLACGKGAGKQRGPREAADAGAAHLASVLSANGGHLDSVMPGATGQPDYANTADAVIALAAGGHRAPAKKSLDWLAGHLGSWDKAENDPAAIGSLMLAAHATGADPAKLGDAALLERLAATGPTPARMPQAQARQAAADEDGEGGGSPVLVWSLIGVGLAAGAGVGFLLVGRRTRRGL